MSSESNQNKDNEIMSEEATSEEATSEEAVTVEARRKRLLSGTPPMMILITVSLIFYLVFFLVSPYDVWYYDTSALILSILGIVIAWSIIVHQDRFVYFIERLLALFIFFIILLILTVTVLHKHLLNLPYDLPPELQYYLIACSSGLMGGLMKYFVFENIATKQKLSLWHMLYAAILGLFVALVLFLLFRSGIISNQEINTYNEWGLAAVSIIAGFFSDRVIQKLSTLYSGIMDQPEKQA